MAAVVIGAVPVTGPSTDPVPPAGGSSTTTLATTTPTTTDVTTSAPTSTQPVATLPFAEPGMVVVADLDMQPVLDVGEDHIGYLAERLVGDGSGVGASGLI